MTVEIRIGDVRDELAKMPAESVHCVVTSPPYWGLRCYGVEGQIGQEPTMAEHIVVMVEVFEEVRRVLRKDGTLWLNYGDCYNAYNGGAGPRSALSQTASKQRPDLPTGFGLRDKALKPKDLCMISNRLAIALQDDGWWVRSEIVWAKLNPMPESVTDRPTSAHEKIWLLSKSERYWYDAEAVRLSDKGTDHPRNVLHRPEPSGGIMSPHVGLRRADGRNGAGANLRNVWMVATQPFKGSHFATFPPDLIVPCIKAGCPEGGTVLDPFGGAGTTGLVADRLGRNAILLELNPEYAEMARQRIEGDAPLFVDVRQEDML